MKILFTLKNFPPSNFGGISSAMYPIIKEINNFSGADVKVLTTSYKTSKNKISEFNNWTTFDNIKVNYFKINQLHDYFFLLKEGVRQIKKSEYVFLNSVFFFPNLIFLIICFINNKKTFILPHGELFKPALNSKYWKKGLYIWIMKFFVKNVLFITTSEQESLRNKIIFNNSNSLVIPNFFNFDQPLNLKKLDQFIFLGRICKIKKIENIIIACSQSKYFSQKNYKLLIAGPTEKEFFNYRRSLKKLILNYDLQKNIQFVGEVFSPEKEKLLSQSKSLILVSESENFSNAVVESLSQGTPVIASKGTPWDSLNKTNSGFWISNSPNKIAEKIDEIIQMDRDKYYNLSKNSISLSKDFTKKKILPLWLKLINEKYV